VQNINQFGDITVRGVRRRPEPEALKVSYEAKKLLHETRQELLDKRYKARKALYEQQKEAHLKLGDLVDFGVGSVRRPIGGGQRTPPSKRWVERVPSVRPRTVMLEPEERQPLIDVVDEGEHLRVDVQLRGIPWPEDIVGELEEVSFKHGVLELRLKKRERSELTKREIEALESAEAEKVTARVKEKLMLKLKQEPEARE
jgi:HSP20 family molecular chaperone IbpA